jgi:hypothetical protein
MLLRIIAVQNCYGSFNNLFEPTISCAYVNNKPYVYDTECSLYIQREYFSSLDHIDFLVKKGEFQWTDFSIENGQQVTRDYYDNIVIGEKIIEPLKAVTDAELKPGRISTRHYYEFLKTINKDNPEIYYQLDRDYLSLEFLRNISNMVGESPLTELSDYDMHITLRIRLEGSKFIADQVKNLMKNDNPYMKDEIHHLFSRIFILEREGYIQIKK